MLREIVLQAWDALRRNPTRSILTMLGIVWGIVAVALLIAYGDGFRLILTRAFEAFVEHRQRTLREFFVGQQTVIISDSFAQHKFPEGTR